MTDIISYGGYFNWSFWEHENVKPGDVCYLIRCGDAEGPHGLVLRGKIISEPYQDQDWAGKGRKIFYADWYPQEFIDSELAAPLSLEKLTAEMPDFNWFGGHSGRELPPAYEKTLERIWYTHLRSLLPALNEGLELNPRANELTPASLDFWKDVNAFHPEQ